MKIDKELREAIDRDITGLLGAMLVFLVGFSTAMFFVIMDL